MPTLPIAWFYARTRGVRLVVDWHNYGFTILAMNLRDDHPFVRFYKWCEGFFGARADAHLCVTNALREDLVERWNIK